MDNAFEATANLKQEKRYIKMALLFDRNNLIISVENSYG